MLEFESLRRKCKLNDVLYVSELTYNLLSVSKAVDKGINFIFSENECLIKDSQQKLITTATKVGNLYRVTGKKLCVNCATKKVIAPQKRICGIADVATLVYKAFDSYLGTTWLKSLTTMLQITFHFVGPVLKGSNKGLSHLFIVKGKVPNSSS